MAQNYLFLLIYIVDWYIVHWWLIC